MSEALYIANEFSRMNNNIDSFTESEKLYLLPMSWFEKWSNYVNYKFFLSDIRSKLILNYKYKLNKKLYNLSDQILCLEEKSQKNDFEVLDSQSISKRASESDLESRSKIKFFTLIMKILVRNKKLYVSKYLY